MQSVQHSLQPLTYEPVGGNFWHDAKEDPSMQQLLWYAMVSNSTRSELQACSERPCLKVQSAPASCKEAVGIAQTL